MENVNGKLLPCPFCGEEVESSVAYTASMIGCSNKDCIMIGCLIDNEPWVDEIERRWNLQPLARLKNDVKNLQQQITDMQLKQKEVIEALDTLEAINLERINPRKNCFDDYTYQEMELRCASIDLSFCVKTIRSALGVKE